MTRIMRKIAYAIEYNKLCLIGFPVMIVMAAAVIFLCAESADRIGYGLGQLVGSMDSVWKYAVAAAALLAMQVSVLLFFNYSVPLMTGAFLALLCSTVNGDALAATVYGVSVTLLVIYSEKATRTLGIIFSAFYITSFVALVISFLFRAGKDYSGFGKTVSVLIPVGIFAATCIILIRKKFHFGEDLMDEIRSRKGIALLVLGLLGLLFAGYLYREGMLVCILEFRMFIEALWSWIWAKVTRFFEIILTIIGVCIALWLSSFGDGIYYVRY